MDGEEEKLNETDVSYDNNSMQETEKKAEVITENTTTTNNTTTVERKGFNVTSLILGIVSIVCFFIWYVSIPTGIMAIIFSVAGRKNAGRGMGIAGLILGIIGFVLSLLVMVFIVGLAAAFIGTGLSA